MSERGPVIQNEKSSHDLKEKIHRWFISGNAVKVLRSGGTLETGWKTGYTDPQQGCFVSKEVKGGSLERWIPTIDLACMQYVSDVNDIDKGPFVYVKRKDDFIERDWKAILIADRRVHVWKAEGDLEKEIPVEEFLSLQLEKGNIPSHVDAK